MSNLSDSTPSNFPLYEFIVEEVYEGLVKDGYFEDLYKQAHCALISSMICEELVLFNDSAKVERHRNDQLISHDFVVFWFDNQKYILDPTYQQFYSNQIDTSNLSKYLLVKETEHKDKLKEINFPKDYFSLYNSSTQVDLHKEQEIDNSFEVPPQELFDKFFKNNQ